jgi:hypothetical protein
MVEELFAKIKDQGSADAKSKEGKKDKLFRSKIQKSHIVEFWEKHLSRKALEIFASAFGVITLGKNMKAIAAELLHIQAPLVKLEEIISWFKLCMECISDQTLPDPKKTAKPKKSVTFSLVDEKDDRDKEQKECDSEEEEEEVDELTRLKNKLQRAEDLLKSRQGNHALIDNPPGVNSSFMVMTPDQMASLTSAICTKSFNKDSGFSSGSSSSSDSHLTAYERHVARCQKRIDMELPIDVVKFSNFFDKKFKNVGYTTGKDTSIDVGGAEALRLGLQTSSTITPLPALTTLI